MIGVDKMEFDDSVILGGFGLTGHTKEFMNVKSNRMISDRQSLYKSDTKLFDVQIGECQVKDGGEDGLKQDKKEI